MQIYFHSRRCSYLSRVPILVEGTVFCVYIVHSYYTKLLFFSCIKDLKLESNAKIYKLKCIFKTKQKSCPKMGLIHEASSFFV